MDDRIFDGVARRFAATLTRRRAVQVATGGLVAGLLGAVPSPLADRAEATAGDRKKKRCKKPQQRCTKSAQCCGKKNHICGFSHGGGTAVKTCCGQVGAACAGSALGCCVPLVCGPNNTCVNPEM